MCDVPPSGSFSILICNGNESFPLTVFATSLVEKVKEQIRQVTGIPVIQQRLTHNGEPLEDGKTLFSCGIKEASTLVVANVMSLLVKTPAGETISLEVSPTDSIETVKEMIQEQLGTPTEEQRLSMIIDNGHTLLDYKVSSGMLPNSA